MMEQIAMAAWNTIDRVDDEAERVAKLIFKNDTAVAEAVLYRYPDYATRTVICCSSQSGCPVGCRFCGAGDAFVRSLTADEIVEQAEYALSLTGTNTADMGRLQIMFMSMGEPLLNQRALCDAIRTLHSRHPKAALLISTSAPAVDMSQVFSVSKDVETVGLQFSVHESTDAARDVLIPFKAKMTLSQIADAGERWARETGRHPFFNYCAHDANSTDEDADRILSLFDPRLWCATVSVVCERSDGMPATNDHQRSLATGFGDRLLVRGYDVRIFDPAGQDTIGGGCGQLWFVQDWMKQHPNLARPSVGSGLPEIHAPVASSNQEQAA